MPFKRTPIEVKFAGGEITVGNDVGTNVTETVPEMAPDGEMGNAVFTTELRWIDAPDRLEVKCVRADGEIEWRKCQIKPDQP